MSNLPKDPKPHIETKKTAIKREVKHKFDYDKVLEEMVKIVKLNNKLEKKKSATQNENIYG